MTNLYKINSASSKSSLEHNKYQADCGVNSAIHRNFL